MDSEALETLERMARTVSDNYGTYIVVGACLFVVFSTMLFFGVREFLSWYLRISELQQDNKALKAELKMIRKQLENLSHSESIQDNHDSLIGESASKSARSFLIQH